MLPYSFVSFAKFWNNFLVPTFSKAISSKVSLPMGVTLRIIPLPKVLWETLSPDLKLPAGAAGAGFLMPGA